MKRLILLVIALAVIVVGVYEYVHVRQDASDTSRLEKAVQQLAQEQKEYHNYAAALSCQVTTLQRNPDYPAILKGKSIEEIKQLIQKQLASC